MTLAPEAKAYLEEQDAMWRAAGPNLTPAQVREIAGRDSGSGGVVSTDVDIHHDYFVSPTAYIPVVVFTPKNSVGLKPALVFYHGGGWTNNTIMKYAPQMSAMAAEGDLVVVGVNYQKAPEHKFPIPFDDCYAGLEWVLKNAERFGIDPTAIGVGGDSAGGNLAACVAIKARDSGLVNLAFQALIYPTTSFELEKKSVNDHATGFGLSKEALHFFWRGYCSPEHDSNPYSLPSNERNLAGVASAIIGLAEHDVLRDDGMDYGEQLKAAGVNVVLKEYPGMIHGFFSNSEKLPAGKALRLWLVEEINKLCR